MDSEPLLSHPREDQDSEDNETSQVTSDESDSEMTEKDTENERETDNDDRTKDDAESTEREDEKGKRKGVVEIMNDYLESIFSTEEEHDDEVRFAWTCGCCCIVCHDFCGGISYQLTLGIRFAHKLSSTTPNMI